VIQFVAQRAIRFLVTIYVQQEGEVAFTFHFHVELNALVDSVQVMQEIL
jgi:hypothetical protein